MSDLTTDQGCLVVLGGARGIGAEVAKIAASSGRRCAVVDFSEVTMRFGYQMGDIKSATYGDLEEKISRYGADATNGADLARIATQIQDDMGPIDQLAITAGAILGGKSLVETSTQELLSMIDANLVVLHNAITSFIPLMKETKERSSSASIVAVVSVAASKALGGIGAYCAAKGAMVAYLRTLALELAPDQINVNWVCPGSTRGAMLDQSAVLYGLSDVEEFSIHHALGRLINPKEIAEAISFLLSPAASAITGAEIFVDAGMHL
ncbi:SDR family oxidoreductase [Acidithrix ferrooxidans]|uniref:3-alpha-(Or 20-beta)-hydroxysteroid dehydrogenase n=1 Tax=Acidithrix ferrooxidans TaxID=1280514 RepID=A0A0D8HFD9_9ACTN|nr:SDR family oxidoreductase [Acidithrix ferrooxidans]KJF16638.1 3-alpha-(or 20-beta)-hydroxysteroid dehydrogenase [Acidithrix ferrooxidans]